MKSICIKTNHPKSIEYLLEKLNNSNLEHIYFSCKNFKFYTNVIVHFVGENNVLFLHEISKLLSFLVIDLFEENIVNRIISSEYFYFDSLERFRIANLTLDDLYDDEEAVYPTNKSFYLLYNNFYEYLSSSHSIVLQGFITFRIKNYIEILSDQIDKSVNKFLIEREYSEFISLLKMYINTETSSCDVVHLVYCNSKSFLLDKDKNVIKSDENMFNAKYLSDISFSSSDYAFNTLLTLVPKKIFVHLIDSPVDEFINTVKLVFENRVAFCSDCNICQLYKKRIKTYK